MSVQVKGSGTIGGLDEGLVVSGIVTSSTQINVGSNIKLGSAGVVTATSFSGSGANLTNLPAANLTGTLPAISGANLTSLPSQVTIANNANDRVITGGSGTNLNGEANLQFDGGHLILGNGKGIRANYIRPTTMGNTNTGGASQQYWKLGEISLNGSEAAEITLLGANGYSSGNTQVYGKTTIILRGSNGNTLLGGWWVDGGQGAHYADVRWKYISGTNYELWVSAGNFNNIAPFCKTTGTFDQTNAGGTNSNTPPTGSTALPQTHYRSVGTINTIEYTSTHTRYLRNIKMDNGYGIDFSATGNISGTSSELLDDYEEGSWTPVVQGWDTFTPYSGSSYYQGWYVKVGGMVHCGWKIYIQHLTTPSSNAHVRIHGLPFTSRAVAAGPVAVIRFDIVETGITNNQWNYMGGNSNTIYLYKQTNGGNGANAINASQNYSNMWTMGTATYATDS